MKNFSRTFLIMTVVVLSACGTKKINYIPVERKNFQTARDGKQVDLYTLKNNEGMTVQITNFGGKIVSIIVPDREGKLGDVCLGYESAEAYFNGSASLGATIGRFANRIAGAEFNLGDSTYHLAKNNGENSIHGGSKGFRLVVWDAHQIDDHTLELSYFSKDGEEGYPGNLQVKVTYSVTEKNELRLDYKATSDKPTVLNLTNHAFFNLNGEGNGDVLNQALWVNANKFTPVNDQAIPTGELLAVKGTPFDFTTPHMLGERIDEDNQQLKNVGGYDHNFVLNKDSVDLAFAASLTDAATGRVLEVYTTEPGLQVYTANSLTGKGTDIGKGGHSYGPRSAVCLETQHFPDSPHHPNFPSTVLQPGETFHSTTVYKFGTFRQLM